MQIKSRKYPFLVAIVFVAFYFRRQNDGETENNDGYYVETDGTFCSKKEAVEKFRAQRLLNPLEYPAENPYENTDNLHEQALNPDLVCAIHYADENRLEYLLREYESERSALSAKAHVTHRGRCGHCSSTKDLSVYMSMNLTDPVRRCTLLTWISQTLTVKCLNYLGFSDECALIWYYNARHTGKHCTTVCLISWLFNEPFNRPDGSLNECLQCDEDHSGPVFKYYAGRTRRNSGIVSAIDRPGVELYNMSHCYF